MSIISYANLLANAQDADIKALNILSQNIVVRTTDPVEADAYEAQCERLFQANVECVISFKRGKERAGDGTIYHTFEARVDPVAANYVAQLAAERLLLSRAPIGG